MKNYGTISYNIYCNFTNYGSALQTWALNQSINKLGYHAKLIDYCPDILADKNPLNPFKNMWDHDEESRKMCELTMPAIHKNYEKFNSFYNNCFDKTKTKYISDNFNKVVSEVDGFVCGSDTIFCPDEFGFDNGYFANYECMRNNSIAYAASFGDPHFSKDDYKKLNLLIQNFKALGIREALMIPYLKNHTTVPVKKVIDPTLLLSAEDYEPIIGNCPVDGKYLLLYSRRYNPIMEAYAEKLAHEKNLKIVEISLRAENSEKGHIMKYDAGVEEFLGLIKNANYVITNSYHGMIFSIQFNKEFLIFSREQCNSKITELLDLFGLSDRIAITGQEPRQAIDYNLVQEEISRKRLESINFLKAELDELSR